MAYESMGLVKAASAEDALKLDGSHSCRIGIGGSQPVYLRFATLTGTDTLASFTISLMWRGVPKATSANPATVYGDWQTLGKTVTAADLTHAKRAGMVQWAIPLTDIGGSAWGASSSWAMTSRKYDELDMQFSVTAAYVSGVTGDTPTGTAECWVGYCPNYTVKAASFDLDSLTIELGRSSTWLRADDRWALTSLAQGGADLKPRTGDWYGNWQSVTVPVKSLRRNPQSGTLDVGLRINAAYKAIGSTLATASGSVTVKDLSTCNTPTVSVTVSNGHATVTVADSGDRGVAITRAVVRLRDGLECDVQECAVPGTVTLPCLPAGKSVIEVVGTDALESTANSRTVSVTVDNPRCTPALWDTESGDVFDLNLDVSWSRSAAPEATVEKLAGRERSSAWYGTGAEVTCSLGAAVVGDDLAVGAAIDRLQEVRHAVVRMPDGYRKAVAVTDFSAERSVGYATVSFSLTEVGE